MLLHQAIWTGTSSEGAVCLLPEMANRHGLIAGATGTGKTVTLQVLTESFSQLGVPVFLADVKGDLAGLSMPGTDNEKIRSRMETVGLRDLPFKACPVTFWDVYGEKGHPIRTTITQMGPQLLARMLSLNEIQTGVLHIVFRIAAEENLLLLDIKDLRAMLAYVGENAADYTLTYGNISKASIGAIQRALAMLEDDGGSFFFGEPALNIADWLRQDKNGEGMINILAADKLFRKPLMYSTFLLWMLDELYSLLPEQGDSKLPRLVFFFDEAHLLFDNCPKVLLERVEQVVRLIRSKGVGVYFITQSPTDVPTTVLAQLSGRVEHALRAFTPAEQKNIRAVAQTFRPNPKFDTESTLSTLGTGEALLSFLQSDGTPSVVQRAVILPPQSRIGTITDEERRAFMACDGIGNTYDTVIDRASAYEWLSEEYGEQETSYQVVRPIPGTYQAPAAPRPAPAPIPTRVYNPQTGKYETANNTLTTTNGTVIPYVEQVEVESVPHPGNTYAQTTVPNYTTSYYQPAPVPPPHRPAAKRAPAKRPAPKRKDMSYGGQLLDTFAKSATSTFGRELARNITKSLLGGKKRR